MILDSAQVALLNIFYVKMCMLKLLTNAKCWLYCLHLKRPGNQYMQDCQRTDALACFVCPL